MRAKKIFRFFLVKFFDTYLIFFLMKKQQRYGKTPKKALTWSRERKYHQIWWLKIKGTGVSYTVFWFWEGFNPTQPSPLSTHLVNGHFSNPEIMKYKIKIITADIIFFFLSSWTRTHSVSLRRSYNANM